MMSLLTAGMLAFAIASTASAQSTQTKCDSSNKCPQDSPCCSSYGICGVGAYCLGGCDPKSSFNLQACMAAPVCSSQDFQMTSLDGIMPNTQYLGDSSSANWVSSGQPQAYQNEAVLLTMAPNTVGTLLSSTHYVWYGKISATMTTSQGPGVVTAFIMMSDMKDEIDFEFVGVDLEHAQSNYYFQGVTDYHNEMNLSVSNTVANKHTYTIDWSPTNLTWSIDGVVLRTLNKADTYNETDKQYHYPQTPSRVQLSLWPAGLASNGQGTIEWAGGLVNWDASQYMANGYYYAEVFDVNVQCYDPPSDAQIQGTKTYIYNNVQGVESDVAITNNNTILGSFYADGLNADYNPNAKASGSSAAASSTPSAQPNTVPGMTGTGGYGNDASSNQNQGSSAVSSAPGSSSTGSSSSGGGFSQGGGSNTGDGTRVVAGSLVALVAFFAALMMI